MKQNKGITLIALVITIIVLLILAGIVIASLTGQDGVLNRASEAKYDNILGSVEEQAKLSALSLKTSITSNMANQPGYLATAPANFEKLVSEVMKGLGVATVNTASAEDYAVYQYLNPGSDSVNGTGYILITYSDNALRSSLDTTQFTLTDGGTSVALGTTYKTALKETTFSRNQAVVAYVIKVSNYKSELSNGIITTSTTVADAAGKATATGAATPSATGLYAAACASATDFDGVKIGAQDGFTKNTQ